MTPPRNSFTFKLSPPEQAILIDTLRSGNYRPLEVPYAQIAAQGEDCTIALYNSGKCLVQGKGAQDWVTFVLEPNVLKDVRIGYDELFNPEAFQPHMGIDESGKGDFFGPLVIAAAYVDEELTYVLQEMNVRDSKTITTDRRAEEMARDIRKVLGHRFSLVAIGPRSYNRLYASMRNVNQILAWGHARAIENLLDRVPDCPRAVADQFGPKRQIEQALMKKGRKITLVQRPKAESDVAVAAASVLARAGFLDALRSLRKRFGTIIPKGASPAVKETAKELVGKNGPGILLEIAKCHFKTTDDVLKMLKLDRGALGPEGRATSKVKDQRVEHEPA